MKESTIINNFKKVSKSIQGLNGKIQMVMRDIHNTNLYLKTKREYDKKWYTLFGILPKSIYPGKKIFEKIYKKLVQEDRKKMKEAYENIKKEKEEQEKNKSMIHKPGQDTVIKLNKNN